MQEIIDLCRDRGIPVRFEPRDAIDRAAKLANHQGIVAFGAVRKYADISDLSPGSRLVMVLDGIEDPHNLGAIIRTAHAAGADAVVCPERRAAGLTETVAKAAAGAIEHLPVIRVSNVNRSLDELKSRGFWIYGLDERGRDVYSTTDYVEPTALVLGGEGHGLHEQVRKHCDFVIRIPMAGAISSLNVSVAAGIVLFDWVRKKRVTDPRR